jgi:hypothetical protein
LARNYITIINYPIIAVNVGIIGSLFIFFAIALEAPASTILGLQTKKCSFGFNLLAQHTVMVGAILIIPFSISSVLAIIHNSREAAAATSIGFAAIIVATIIILSSPVCGVPTDFFIEIIVVPSVVIAVLITGIHMYSERKKKSKMK